MPEQITREELRNLLLNYVPKRYLTQKEAVIYTGTSPGTINQWVKDGLRIILFGENSNPKYDIKDLDDWMEDHKTKGA
ncbi:helix-turn-helix transcriptional regulator [Enterococcus hailinensis]|uniref:helix-turn-helix transcriptional regulator n=1 Tax=Enterococcus hailinensis TaxID=3238988 RepID=UPI0038B2E049